MTRRDGEISCPNCETKIPLKFSKKDGIQCKKCYNWIPSFDIDKLLIREQELIVVGEPIKQEVNRETICPECKAIINFTNTVDGGVMCKKCYSWVTPEEEVKTIKSQPPVKKLIESVPTHKIERPFIIGKKLEDLPEHEKIIPIIPISGNDIIDDTELTQQQPDSIQSSGDEPDSWDKPKSRTKTDTPQKMAGKPVGDKKKMRNLFRSHTFDIKRIIGKRPESKKLPPREDTTTMDVSTNKRERAQIQISPNKSENVEDKDTAS
ncbi:MAG: hypothetical protein K8T10_03035 [Candidatus Eremiobacteraeota bacterium]|nr:hypothetical protein [Candidatus Eremiobacteraeota bacterium]